MDPLVVACSAAVLLLLTHALRFRAVDFIVCGLPIAVVVGTGFRVNLSPADAFLPFAFVAACRGHAARRQRSPRSEGAAGRIHLYGLAVILAMMASLVIRIVSGEPTDATYGYAAIAKIVIGLGYLVVFSHFGHMAFAQPDRLIGLWVKVATVAAVAGIVGVILYSRGVTTFLTQDYRADAAFDDPNLFASYLLLSIAMVFIAHSQQTLRHPVPYILLMTVALIATGSRAGVPALAAGLTIALIFGGSRAVAKVVIAWLTLGAVAVAIVSIYAPTLFAVDSLTRILEGTNTAEGDVRVTLWAAAWDMWLDHPLLGVGIGQFIATSPEYVPGGLSNLPHNTHLGLLAEIGIVGYALVLAVPFLTLLRLLFNRSVRSMDAATASWLAFGVAASLVLAFTLNLENSRMFWAFVGLGVAFVGGRRPVLAQEKELAA